jgi:hypothetical protein
MNRKVLIAVGSAAVGLVCLFGGDALGGPTKAVCRSGCAGIGYSTTNLSDADTLHAAEQVLLRDCMVRAGFEYQITPASAVPDQRTFPYVIDDVAWAQRHGYGTDIQRSLTALRAADPNQRYFRSLPAARRAAALVAANGARPTGLVAKDPQGGVMTHSDQGCQADVDRELYGDAQAWFQAKVTAQAMSPMKVERVTADSRFTTATAGWAGCMRSAGYHYDNPAKAREALPPPEKPLPFAGERRMAVTEAQCAVSSGLSATAKALDTQYELELHRQYSHDLGIESALKQAALPRARDVLSGTDHGF